MLFALLAAFAFSQHADLDLDLDPEVEHAEERLAELEQAVEQREHELELVTAQANRLVELLARERGVPVEDLPAVEEGDEPDDEPEADTGEPDAVRENEHAVELDDEEGT